MAGVDPDLREVTSLFSSTGSKVLAKSLKSGGVILACRLLGFDGLVGREVQPGRRLGTEMSDRAQRAGVGGIFHTDELPAYGMTEEEVEVVRRLLCAGDGDCVVMVTGPADRAEKALRAVQVRAREALSCVPEETRRALPDGCSEYMRPLPGSARMYPETDVPSVVITEEMLARLKLPELFDQRAERFQRQYGLNPEQARVMAASPNYQLFEEIVGMYRVPASVVVRALETIPIELAREGVPVSNLTDQHYRDCFALVDTGRIAKEGLGDLLRALAGQFERTAAEAAQAAGLAGVDEAGVEKVVRAVVASKADQIGRAHV
jgi:glutamyl-tRNA(Gln) amidotransferase subunit E